MKRLRRNIVVYILKILLIIVSRILNTTKYINKRVQNRDDNKNEFSKIKFIYKTIYNSL